MIAVRFSRELLRMQNDPSVFLSNFGKWNPNPNRPAVGPFKPYRKDFGEARKQEAARRAADKASKGQRKAQIEDARRGAAKERAANARARRDLDRARRKTRDNSRENLWRQRWAGELQALAERDQFDDGVYSAERGVLSHQEFEWARLIVSKFMWVHFFEGADGSMIRVPSNGMADECDLAVWRRTINSAAWLKEIKRCGYEYQFNPKNWRMMAVK